jgi:hypothetical protein
MKKVLSLVLLVAVVVGAVGFTPANRISAATPSLATLMPADTFLFAEMRTDDLPNALKTISDLLSKASIPANLQGDLERTLSQGLGRPATLEKDISSWLGERAAVGVYVPDSAIESLFTRRQSTEPQIEGYFVVSIKDEAAADAFFAELLALGEKTGAKLTRATDQIGDTPVITYADSTGKQIIARWQGYIALGTPSIAHLLDALKNKKPTLADDRTFQKVIGMLKPDNFATVYSKMPLSPLGYVVVLGLMGPSIGAVFDEIVRSLNQTPGAQPTAIPTPTPTPTPSPALLDLASTLVSMGATGMGFYGDGKKVAIDFAFAVDPDSLKRVFSILEVPADIQLQTPASSISLKVADRISNKALGVIIGSGLAQNARNGLTLARAAARLFDIMDGTGSRSSQGLETSYAQLESGLKQYFDLDLNQDVLGWMDGDFSLYMMYNPNGDMARAGQGPFDFALLIDSTDAAKTDTFLTKLNAGLTKTTGSSPTQTDSGLFVFQPSATGPGIGYGLVKNTFLVGNSSGLAAAANAALGDGTLASDANWKEATASLPESYQHVWYIDMTKLGAALQDSASQNGMTGDQRTAAIINLLRSVLLYSTDLGGGSSLTTVELTLN